MQHSAVPTVFSSELLFEPLSVNTAPMTTVAETSNQLPTAHPDPRISGRKLVAVMFALGFLATGLLWFYWDMHLRPFMPLQKALAEQYENSSPRVDGGQRRIHKSTPKVLRVVMRAPFDPNSGAEDVQAAIAERIQTTVELATRYAELNTYDLLEVHLYHEEQEKALSQRTFQRQVASPNSL